MNRWTVMVGVVAGAVAFAAASEGEEERGRIDQRPLPLRVEPTFKGVRWPGWSPQTDAGEPRPFRPILVTHAGDRSSRLFIPSQFGKIYVLPAGAQEGHAEIFLDIEPKVSYNDKTNEEGFLGLAFHPRFQENGEFFVFYTNRHRPHQNVVSRFKVDAAAPNRADPESEEILLVFDKPFWNHDGGTVCFGPDGYLYVTHGDGGMANDPFGNGQNKKSLLGKILRIDVDRKAGGKNYAIPADNPFAAGEDGERPEIWAYGLRNVWRMAFDRKTGVLWAADVGQDAWEEINLIVRGGNYGWNLREGKHPFGKNGVGPRSDLIDPIWEYGRSEGKSITGGLVYRGTEHPELDGAYLFADYVSGRIWALWYDTVSQKVVAHREIKGQNLPILSFGEDAQGEVYLTTHSLSGEGILRLARDE